MQGAVEPGTDLQADSERTNAAAPDATAEPINLEALYRKHQRHLLRFVQRYVRNPDDANDIVQSTFLEAIRCADRFSGLSKPSTWLFGIALNLSRNHVRRGFSAPFEAVEDSILEQFADIHGDPAMILELRQIADKVEAMLRELPAEMRTTFDAVLDGEATYAQAAKDLNIPIGTVRSRVSRVRAAVRAQCP
jgi:RNA polymerase sigma factor (sigma-70 family)